MKLAKLLFPAALFLIVNDLQANSLNFTQALNLTVQGETHKPTQLMQTLTELEREKLSILLAIENEQTSIANKSLKKLQKHYNNEASVHYFAGVVWPMIRRQSGLFNKMSLIDLHAEAFVKAYQLEPQNFTYKVKAASSFTQLNSDNLNKQTQLTQELKSISERHYLLAAMDLAQNNRDMDKLIALASSAMTKYPSDVMTLHRAANAFWTAENTSKTQQVFHQTCLLKPPTTIDIYYWFEACYLSAYLGIETNKNFSLVQLTLGHLRKQYHEDTQANADIQIMLAKAMIKNDEVELAAIQLNHILESKKSSKKQRKQAKKLLQHR